MAENGLKEQISAMIEKAVRSLEAAKILCDGKNYDFSSSRSYYSVFYALEALLLTKKLVFSKHAGVIAAFSEHFIREGIFPKETARYVSRLFRERHIGDYDFGQTITLEDARMDYEIASELVSMITDYLKEHGYY